MHRISELMDGELDERETQAQIARLGREDELRERWDAFHLIGDALRGERPLSGDFSRRLSQRLREEPTVLAPRRTAPRRIAAYALSAAASLSAVALVAWVAVSTGTIEPRPAEIAVAPAAAPTPQLAAAPVPVSVPDEGRMSEYLLAHQGVSPSTVIQGVAPYIRTVSARQTPASR